MVFVFCFIFLYFPVSCTVRYTAGGPSVASSRVGFVSSQTTHDEPDPGQTYARQEPAVEIEIRWCPAHKGIPGNEVADEWAKLAASEPG